MNSKDLINRYTLLAATLLFQLSARAQTDDFPARIEQSTALLQQLDSKAGACLTAFEANEEVAGLRCREFLAAVDGELLASYVSNCQLLKEWRDEFVNDALSNPANLENSAENLQLMVGIEYTCGEGAMQKRTTYVSSAFTLLTGGQSSNSQVSAEINQRLAELKFDQTLNNERRLLQNAINQQQSIRLQETQEQFNNLENELIRQQINN